jgi:hypothetical protein
VGKVGGQLYTLANNIRAWAGAAIWFGSPRFLKTVYSKKLFHEYGKKYGIVILDNISILVAN